ncbi:hypothetical protein QYQ98_10000 [Corynebacterium sp. P3-F1]|uniref:hypothetical protein n=1 Tax=Corynebacterium sp. P3-F1 TaxID=3059080 RepID=UPI00265C9E52|nr:hypothetical protein [Corynebacterium sp. P3-F1]WKK61326.1 hypothetical protein QYQ98_10000 [Corynebacterium sp. P3-F1]
MTLTDKQREETLRRINNYVPRGTDRGTWNNISDFVRATAIAATVDSETGSEVFVSNNTSSLDVRGVLRVLTRASAHAFSSGRELTVGKVLGRENVEAVVASRQAGKSRYTEAYLLRLVREAIDGQELSIYHRRDTDQVPDAPYAPRDWEHIRRWVMSQSTQLRFERAAVIVGLGLGAGIGAEIGHIQAKSIRKDSHGVVWVDVSHRAPEGVAPEVPVASVFGDIVFAISQRRDPDEMLLGGAATDLREVMKRLSISQPFRVELNRLRATWVREVVRHLPRETAAAAAGSAFGDMRRYEKRARLTLSRPDTLAERLDVLANPLSRWAGLDKPEDFAAGAFGATARPATPGTAADVVEMLPRDRTGGPAAAGLDSREEASDPDAGTATVTHVDFTAHSTRTPNWSDLPAPEQGRLLDFVRNLDKGNE